MKRDQLTRNHAGALYPSRQFRGVRPVLRYCIVFCWASLLALILFSAAVLGGTVSLELKRIIIIESGPVIDSYTQDLAPRGRLVIETDSANVIRGIEYEAWIRGEVILSDRAAVLSYSMNGARYEVYSLITDERYTLRFIRRAPLNDSYDPATIIVLELDDGSLVILDYRYIA